MINIDQTKLHDPEKGIIGNCFIACVASIIEFPLIYVPEFEKMPGYNNGSGDWFILIDDWLRYYNYEMNIHRESKPYGYSIISGISPRNNDVLHSCIALDGELMFDPHPSRKGIVSVRDYITVDSI